MCAAAAASPPPITLIAPLFVARAIASPTISRAAAIRGAFVDAHRSVEDDRFRGFDHRRVLRRRCRTDVEDHLVADVGDRARRARAFVVERRRDDRIAGKCTATPRSFVSARIVARRFEIVVAQRAPDVNALCREQRVRHAAAETKCVDLRAELLENADLVFDLRAADDADVRLGGIGGQPRRAASISRSISRSGGAGQQMRERFGRSVRAMRGRERVVDVEIAQRASCARERRIVALLARMEAHVLEQ